MSKEKQFRVVGLMSGSSLDAVDLAVCRFDIAPEASERPVLDWEMEATDAIPFPAEWRERLRQLPRANAATYVKTDVELGHYFGWITRRFLEERRLRVDAIASHGHTIFHFPKAGATAQIGDGAAIAAETGLTTINNFRAMDMAFGGQGAPLAPIADQYLFPEYDYWLNIGGIANLTARKDEELIAFDVGGANQIFDALVAPLGMAYDHDGDIARNGRVLPALLQQVDALPYFHRPYPKSLGNDWVQEVLLPLYQDFEAATEDKLATAVHQLARQIAQAINIIQGSGDAKNHRLLATGGGALNTFLIEGIREECAKFCSLAVVVPAPEIVQFKEAALMALMGALRLAALPNCLSSVTGARRDAMGGGVHQPEAGFRHDQDNV